MKKKNIIACFLNSFFPFCWIGQINPLLLCFFCIFFVFFNKIKSLFWHFLVYFDYIHLRKSQQTEILLFSHSCSVFGWSNGKDNDKYFFLIRYRFLEDERGLWITLMKKCFEDIQEKYFSPCLVDRFRKRFLAYFRD